ncbi:molybdopterin-binding domain-containing protein [Flavobacterium poyangense]|uniref:hypothetical protein n=1 Tax=Flavobacterium poyangense TaxID=2204302 RepID=UPI00142163E5|nr:hypothetical protein [Flavobacterium sp. JXAS1]
MIKVNKVLTDGAAISLKSPIQKIGLENTLDCVLGETIYAPISTSAFRLSTTAGYAFIHSERHQYDLIRDVSIADRLGLNLKSTEALWVEAGTFMPEHADTIVTEDYVMANDKSILITIMPEQFAGVSDNLKPIAKGDIVFEAGILITQEVIGFLTSLGVMEVGVCEL